MISNAIPPLKLVRYVQVLYRTPMATCASKNVAKRDRKSALPASEGMYNSCPYCLTEQVAYVHWLGSAMVLLEAIWSNKTIDGKVEG